MPKKVFCMVRENHAKFSTVHSAIPNKNTQRLELKILVAHKTTKNKINKRQTKIKKTRGEAKKQTKNSINSTT